MVNVTIGIVFCVDWHDSYTWLSTVCPTNACKNFMSTQAGLSLLWIYLSFCRFCCAPTHLQLRCTTLEALFVVHKFYQAWITHKARKIILILNQIVVLPIRISYTVKRLWPGHDFCQGQMMHKPRKRELSILLTAHCLIRYTHLWSFVTIFLTVQKLWPINKMLPRTDN